MERQRERERHTYTEGGRKTARKLILCVDCSSMYNIYCILILSKQRVFVLGCVAYCKEAHFTE